MKPVLDKWPPKKRAIWFGPIAFGAFLLTFLVLAFATQQFFVTILLAPIAGVAAAYALVGFPEIKTKDGKPLVEPRHKPYLFFLLAPILALVLYPIFGIALTQAGVPLKLLAIASIVLALATAAAAAYFLVGVPNVGAAVRQQYAQIPPERRPYLFFPVFVVVFLVLYIALGVASTQLLGRVEGDPTGLLNVQVLVLLPLSLLLAGLLAWLLVGIPKPQKMPTEYLPKVTGKRRPQVFLATFLLAGIPLTLVIGALLTAYALLPSALVLPLSVLLGFTLSLGIAALVWGTPARWRRFEDYEPGIPRRVRIPLFVGISLALAVAIVVGFGLAGIDIFWGLLVGLLVGGSVFSLLAGLHRVVLARRQESTLVPDLPDGLKPLILFPTWLLIAGVLFAVLTYALPGLVAVNVAIALLVGLAASFLVLEQPLAKDLLAERRAEKERRKAWEARRKQRLAEAETPPGKGPEA